MEINVRDDQRLVEVWLTKEEKQCALLQEQLHALYARYHRDRYTVAVYQSGCHSLYQNTLGLLAHNKRLAAKTVD